MVKPAPFVKRHIGRDGDHALMLKAIGMTSSQALVDQLVPADVRFTGPLDIPAGIGEMAALEEISEKIGRNTIAKPMIGQGYCGAILPPVIQRHMAEQFSWYASPPPFAAEISQGRLEMLFHFQTLVQELTGLPLANASMVDETTALREAVKIARRHHLDRRKKVVSASALHPHLKAAVSSIFPMEEGQVDGNTCAVILQWPDTFGRFVDPTPVVSAARQNGALVIVAADPMALVLLPLPSSWGADICIGSMQRFGLPLGHGGPHAAYMAVSKKLAAQLPGWIVERSEDGRERAAFGVRQGVGSCAVPTLQASMATAYALWHGPEGLVAIAQRIHSYANRFAKALVSNGFPVEGPLFDTVTVHEKGRATELVGRAERWGLLLRQVDENTVSIAFDETSNETDLQSLCAIFDVPLVALADGESLLPAKRRGEDFLPQPAFHACHSEAAMTEFLATLTNRDLNAERAGQFGAYAGGLPVSAQMMPQSWEITSNLHPFAPPAHRLGYQAIMEDLDRWLCSITGHARCSFHPDVGLQTICAYHRAGGDHERMVCFIPEASHPATLAMVREAGLTVVQLARDSRGQLCLTDLGAKCAQYGRKLAALIINYPTPWGGFDRNMRDGCAMVHEQKGQVMLDGRNMAAMMGLVRPGDFGIDVCRLDLHRAFGAPMGGGDPQLGAVCVEAHLMEHLPCHRARVAGECDAVPLHVSSVLLTIWMRLRLLGGEGLRRSSEAVVLNANYVAARLRDRYPPLSARKDGLCAHQVLLTTDPWGKVGLKAEHFAKRLMDYAFPPVVANWPVDGALLIELAAGVSKPELDGFISALNAIAEEANKVVQGVWPAHDNPLVNAPHTMQAFAAHEWNHPYSRQQACFPMGVDGAAKYWPAAASSEFVTVLGNTGI
ncbi:MAG: glycine dehydrogenase (aminomethyl-transferring) [Pseudomonadota bacterium]